MRAIDRDAIEKRGMPSRLLMETAGRAVAAATLGAFRACMRPVIACGPGNNGGDGFVVARVMAELRPGLAPKVLVLGDVARHSRETRENHELVAARGFELIYDVTAPGIPSLCDGCDLIVDAVLGVGSARPVEGELGEIVAALDAVPVPKVAVDVPTGVSSDTGTALGRALAPSLIVTLGLPKLGLAVQPHACPILVADIGLPAESIHGSGVAQWLLTDAAVAARLPPRPRTAHKGHFGHLLVVAGSRGKTGAATLAARGALRAGAGLVTAATAASVQPVLAAQLIEAMTLPLHDGGAGVIDESALPALRDALAARDVLLIGPGLSDGAPTQRAVRAFLAAATCPAVVDADALNAFAGQAGALRSAAPRVLTPHPGEAARLLGRSTADVQADRAGAARALVAQTGAVVILKGARTLVAAPDGTLAICPTGGPGLASGGSGDVLAGVVAALLCQGVPPLYAACAAVYLHGRAGERRAVGQLASEVADAIPDVWAALLTGATASSVEVTREPALLRPFP
jgi:NAD(P)H-hydrate epimerase